jgi:hypothetical protein
MQAVDPQLVSPAITVHPGASTSSLINSRCRFLLWSKKVADKFYLGILDSFFSLNKVFIPYLSNRINLTKTENILIIGYLTAIFENVAQGANPVIFKFFVPQRILTKAVFANLRLNLI